MKYFTRCVMPVCLGTWLLGCQYVPEMAKAVDDIATDDAIQVIVSKEAVQSKDRNMIINVSLEKIPSSK